MKPTLMLLAGLLLSPTVLLGQQAGSTFGAAGMENQTANLVIAPPQSCPVSLQAKQSGMTDMIKVNHGSEAQPHPDRTPKPSQRIHFTISGIPEGPKIVGGTVTVRGLSARGRAENADSGSGSPDLRRTLNVTFTVNEDKSLSAELVLPGFTTVRSIRLEAFEYADGTTRDFSRQHGCSVAPDPLMLVAGR